MTDSPLPRRARRLAGRVRRRLQGDRTDPTTGAPPQTADGPAPWQRVLASGIFDRAYYEAQVGSTFAAPRAAVRHYLRKGGPAGLAPHPLFEPEWFRPDAWRPRPDALLGYLDGDPGDPSPWFDDAAYVATHPEAAEHPGRALGHLIEHGRPEDRLPGRRGTTYAAATACAWDGAVEFERYERARVAARRGPWDESADRDFVRRWTEETPQRLPDAAPTVSIVMPVLNRPRQVLTAIRSVQQQQEQGWELVVVDDGSGDDTADVVEAVGRTDPRVRLLRREHGGVSAARNAGIEAARGEWLAFLDSDNTWEPHFLLVMLRYLAAQDLRAGYAVIDARSSGVDPSTGYLQLDAGLDHLLVHNHIDLNGLVVRTEVARATRGFDTRMRRWVDHDFVIGVAKLAEPRLVPFVGVRYDHDDGAADRITTTEPDYWQWVALANGYLDWEALRDGLGARVGGRVSICMPTYQDWSLTTTAVEAVLAAADAVPAGSPGSDVEVVVIDNGSRRAVSALLRARFAGEERVRVRTISRNLNFATGSNLAFAESTGDTVVFLNNDTEVRAGWLAPLVAAVADPEVLGAQPLLLFPDGTVQSAGTVFTGGQTLPAPFLVDHPPEDAHRLGPIPLRVVTGAATVMRAADVVDLRGFDPVFVNGFEDVDLCLRAVDGGERRFLVVTDSTVIHHESRTPGRGARIQANRRLWMQRWSGRIPPDETDLIAPLGLAVAHLHPGPPAAGADEVRMPRPVLVRPPRTDPDGRPLLRWALKTAAPAHTGAAGRRDLTLAVAVAHELRRWGQDVVVDRRESGQRATSYLDDVAVTVRTAEGGPLPVEPGRVNVLWAADPDVVLGADEAARYDEVVSPAVSEPARDVAERLWASVVRLRDA